MSGGHSALPGDRRRLSYRERSQTHRLRGDWAPLRAPERFQVAPASDQGPRGLRALVLAAPRDSPAFLAFGSVASQCHAEASRVHGTCTVRVALAPAP